MTVVRFCGSSRVLDDAARLVQQQMAAHRGRLQPSAIDADVVLLGIDLRPERGDDLVVDLDAALSDEVISRSPRGDAHVREQLVQAHQCTASELGGPSASNGSAVWGCGSPTLAGSSNPSSSDMSSTFGRSLMSFRPKRSRNSRLVP